MEEGKEVEWVARLFDPEGGYAIIEKFATEAGWQAWRQRKGKQEPGWDFGFASDDPWEMREHPRIQKDVKATGRPKVWITRPSPLDDP